MEQNEIAVQQTTGLALRFSDTAIAEMLEQNKQFGKFVNSQLRDGIDFGTLPNVKTPSLWKAGAEKLASLFQLGSRIYKSEKTLDLKENFAMFAVTVEIFHLPTGNIIAQCEGIANSHEKKYKSRKIYEWVNNRKIEKGEEMTPVGDVLNTLNKMAQKRAYVGAVIIATKASDFFTHDLAEDDEQFAEENPNYHAKQQEAQNAAYNKAKQANEMASVKRANDSASFENFQGGFAAPKPPINERAELGKQINAERVRLQWDAVKIQHFVTENFGKQSHELTEPEMTLLIATLKRQEKK